MIYPSKISKRIATVALSLPIKPVYNVSLPVNRKLPGRALLRPLPQHVLLDLARARLGQFLHDLHLPGDHKLADGALVLGPVDDILPAQLLLVLAVLDCEVGLGPLAPVGIGHGDHAGFEHVRVLD